MGFAAPLPPPKRVRTGPSGVLARSTRAPSPVPGPAARGQWLFRRDWACLHVGQRLRINSLLPGNGLVSGVRAVAVGVSGAGQRTGVCT